jgi:methyl-accepting chemotaxis protein
MAKSSFHDELEKRAARAILTRSFYRWESAAIIALTLVLLFFIPQPFAFWQPWFWLLLGALGEFGLVWSSVKDPEFRAKAVSDMFREKFKADDVANKALRDRVEKALYYREGIDQAIATGREGILRDHMADVSRDITAWMENVFRLAKRLDTYMADDVIRQDLQSVSPAIESLKKRLALEDSDAVKRQISQAIAQKQIHRDNLRRLQNAMEQAQFQLESTITAMGTVYSQVKILSARDVASGRAQRLQQEISDQVNALQDVVDTMDEVYQAGADPLGLDLGDSTLLGPAGTGSDPAALDAGGQSASQGSARP